MGFQTFSPLFFRHALQSTSLQGHTRSPEPARALPPSCLVLATRRPLTASQRILCVSRAPIDALRREGVAACCRAPHPDIRWEQRPARARTEPLGEGLPGGVCPADGRRAESDHGAQNLAALPAKMTIASRKKRGPSACAFFVVRPPDAATFSPSLRSAADLPPSACAHRTGIGQRRHGGWSGDNSGGGGVPSARARPGSIATSPAYSGCRCHSQGRPCCPRRPSRSARASQRCSP